MNGTVTGASGGQAPMTNDWASSSGVTAARYRSAGPARQTDGMTSGVTGHLAFPADGFEARWSTGDQHHHDHHHDHHDVHHDDVTLRWENEAWTVTGHVESQQIEYVIRLTAQWQVSQFLLFRDLAEADLWLGTDGHGRWGEVNGAHRPDLDGGTDIALACTPFTHTIPIRRLPLRVGHGAELSVVHVDVETLGVVTAPVRYERLGQRHWRHEHDGAIIEFDVDEYGLPCDLGDTFRRVV